MIAFVTLGLVASLLSQQIGWGERLRTDLFCVGWDIKKPPLNQSPGQRNCCTVGLPAIARTGNDSSKETVTTQTNDNQSRNCTTTACQSHTDDESTNYIRQPFCEIFSRRCKPWITRSSDIAEGPRDASCQLKSCQLSRNSAETTCTTSHERIEVMKLEG